MVAVDDAEPSRSLDWALAYAPHTQAEIELVHVLDLSWRSTPQKFATEALLDAEQQLRELAAQCSARTGLTVHVTVLLGRATSALIEHSSGADLLVMGAPGESLIGDFVNGRAARVAGRVTTSTVVVPHGRPQGSGIVVGVDGSEFSVAALAFGAQEADRLGEPLTVIHSWHAPTPWTGRPIEGWPAEPEDEERRILAEAIAGLAQTYPDLTVHSAVEFGRATNVLSAAAEGTRMLVVGSHGRHGFEKAWLGSTSEELVLAMPTVVAVIR